MKQQIGKSRCRAGCILRLFKIAQPLPLVMIEEESMLIRAHKVVPFFLPHQCVIHWTGQNWNVTRNFVLALIEMDIAGWLPHIIDDQIYLVTIERRSLPLPTTPKECANRDHLKIERKDREQFFPKLFLFNEAGACGTLSFHREVG